MPKTQKRREQESDNDNFARFREEADARTATDEQRRLQHEADVLDVSVPQLLASREEPAKPARSRKRAPSRHAHPPRARARTKAKARSRKRR